MTRWIAGLVFSLGIGHIAIWLFLRWLQRWLGDTPGDKGGKRVPDWVTGSIERLFFTILVGANDASGVPALMLGWLALKLATNWNHPIHKDPELRPFAIRALLAGLLSMMFALVGGLICAGKLPLGI